MNISDDNWVTMFRSLANWHGLGCDEWLKPGRESVSLRRVQTQIKMLGLDCDVRKCNPLRKLKFTEPVFLVTQEDKSALFLLLPPADGQPEWRIISRDGEEQIFEDAAGVKSELGLSVWEPLVIQVNSPVDTGTLDEEERLNPAAGGTRGWFWTAIWEYRKEFFHIIPASLLINLFAIAMPLFIMNVYDRVVPNKAFDTLWVLATGVGIVFGFEFLLRLMRSTFVDAAGKGADSILSRRVFRHTLNMELSARPASAGNFAGQTRGYEAVREFLSSITLIGLLDFPFALMMFGLIFWLGGTLGWVPVVTTVLVLTFVLILQPFLARYAAASHEDRVQRQSLMSETANGLESIKAVNAGPALEKRMATIVDESAEIDLKTKRLTQMGGSFTVFCTHLTTVAVIVLGTYKIAEGQLSMGALIASVMIVGRGMAPLSQVSQLLLRLQATRAALRGLDTVMSTEREDDSATMHKTIAKPDFRFVGVHFQYANQPVLALSGINLQIRSGEKVGLIGRAGSGKTTMQRMMNRQLKATHGLVLLDDIDISHLHPETVRSCSGYLPQDGFLFYGSIKDNIALGGGGFSDDEIIEAARMGGVLEWANSHPDGLDMQVGERGILLSGGQRQTVLLARTMIRKPRVLLLDEPTASLDLGSERNFKQMVTEYLAEDPSRTLVLATHKLALLSLVDRVILLDGGKAVLDGPRDEVLATLRGKKDQSGRDVEEADTEGSVPNENMGESVRFQPPNYE